MKRSLIVPLTALAACGLGWAAFAAPAESTAQPSPMERMQRWTQDHAALLDAKLAGLKAGLKLTPDQEKLWGPFESSVRESAQMRQDRMKARMQRQDENRDDAARMSPIDRLDQMADRLAEGGASLKKIADSAKPLYASLDDGQKHVFGFLSHELMMMGHPRFGMMGPRSAWMGPHPHGPGAMWGPDGQGSRGPDMGPPLHRHDDGDRHDDNGDGSDED
jgi:zinc resistance-associated protein